MATLILFISEHKADTVFQCFQEAVDKYGLPSQVHLDRGVENVFVTNFMLLYPERGPRRGFYNKT